MNSVSPRFLSSLAALALVAVSCTKAPPPAPRVYTASGYGYGAPVGDFNDDARANATVTPEQLGLNFVDADGKPVDLREFRGKKNVVLVMMRGFTGALCPYCTAQTSRLIRNHDEFQKRDAEVLVVWPGPKTALPDFLTNAKAQVSKDAVPFRVLLDADLHMVDRLGLRAELAKPSTFILDKQGQVRFAYVGTSMTDRPSLKAMLDQLDRFDSKSESRTPTADPTGSKSD